MLNNERFMVPELLFHPADIGLQQSGIVEAVVQVWGKWGVGKVGVGLKGGKLLPI